MRVAIGILFFIITLVFLGGVMDKDSSDEIRGKYIHSTCFMVVVNVIYLMV
ncbi:hypothetical protein EDC18_102407 [Natranaerovirga pectinivora]|uniref:Uncharacterized protein n=1 Tax=Natranaerovirga pectinivora TaxID=682400 RepID=A0A4R3MSG7_9FIRM|nr:hypothetical protein [Natranaerovirga pectinivora]TCT16388.1 hypothetical protein EDC18_102407 [Natranaerovirga pectinivora]